MDKVDDIQKVLLHSNRVSHKHALTISKLIVAVSNALKVGFIWDIGPPVTIHQVKELVDELRSQNLITSDVLTVGVAQEICVLNKALFLENSRRFPNVFIDVTKTLDRPRILPAHDPTTTSMVEDIRDQIQKATESSVFLKVAEDIYCVPTILGLLAGYPIVYWYQPCVGDAHCLSGIDLQVFKVLQGNDVLSSFSCPRDLVNEPVIKQTLDAWKCITDRSKDFHVETVTTKNEFTVNL